MIEVKNSPTTQLQKGQLFREKLCQIFDCENTDDNGNYVFDFELAEFAHEQIIANKDKLPILYRYSPADYYNIRCLEIGKLHLSETGKMNDIFEGLTGKVDDRIIKNIDKLHDLAYIKSFSEIKDNLKMWSSYADNYSGMCVAYDVKKLEDKILYHLFPIRYSNNRVTKNNLYFSFKELVDMKKAVENGNSDFSFDFLKDVMGLFVSKSEDWEYEKEWRLIITYLQMNCCYNDVEADGETKYEKILYDLELQDIDFDCVHKIYFGPKMERLKKEHIKEIGKKLGVDVVEMQLSETEYKLIPKE